MRCKASSRHGRAALAEMRRLLGAMRDDGEDVELAPQPGLDSLESLLERGRPRRAARAAARRGRPRLRSRARSTSPPTGSSRKG